MKKCSIHPCDNPAIIKGLCRKHYMRLRRNGDAAVTRKPGPKPSQAAGDKHVEELIDMLAGNRSPRTRARCRRVAVLLMSLGDIDLEGFITTSEANGVINVSNLLRRAEDETLRQRGEGEWGFDSRMVENLLNNPACREIRTSIFTNVSKSIRALRKAKRESPLTRAPNSSGAKKPGKDSLPRARPPRGSR
jgi:hypothetical protein